MATTGVRHVSLVPPDPLPAPGAVVGCWRLTRSSSAPARSIRACSLRVVCRPTRGHRQARARNTRTPARTSSAASRSSRAPASSVQSPANASRTPSAEGSLAIEGAARIRLGITTSGERPNGHPRLGPIAGDGPCRGAARPRAPNCAAQGHLDGSGNKTGTNQRRATNPIFEAKASRFEGQAVTASEKSVMASET